MPPVRLLSPHTAQHACIHNTRTIAQRSITLRSYSSSFHPPPFPVISTCPDPTCPCSAMPTNLDIDRKQNLNSSMSPYTQQLLISTGRSDWTSRIEDEKDTAPWGRFAADIKDALGRKGRFHDPYNNIVVSASSFTPGTNTLKINGKEGQQEDGQIEAFLFPSFQHFTNLSSIPSTLGSFIRAHLLPQTLHPIYKALSATERLLKTRDPSQGTQLSSRHIKTPTILICSHGQRDSRCGILGPLLHDEFRRYINRRTTRQQDQSEQSGLRLVNASVPGPEAQTGEFIPQLGSLDENKNMTIPVNIGMISHVGGHKWAGNVILYIPPLFPSSSQPTGDSTPHPLAGKGIWYGRVEPRHVEGIVEETLVKGNVIVDLFRGGIGSQGEILRL